MSVGICKFHPLWYLYYYGVKLGNSHKIVSRTIVEDVYLFVYHPGHGFGKLLRLGPDSMELVEHSFRLDDFHNLHNHEV